MLVYCDRLVYLWFSTWSGVSCYDGAVFQTLDRRDGLAGNTALTFAEDQEGVLWVGTNAGATLYRRPPLSPPPVYIQAVVADRRYAEPGPLTIPASAGLIAFEFHSINFKTRPGAMLFRYASRAGTRSGAPPTPAASSTRDWSRGPICSRSRPWTATLTIRCPWRCRWRWCRTRATCASTSWKPGCGSAPVSSRRKTLPWRRPRASCARPRTS
ncbi:MAG: hypothetical protein FJY95_11380 [Candidatus Handelsmanbacteria bacterium]|nr:hypothetical protein [Candidatus Handelsmanbacteria bacterium]